MPSASPLNTSKCVIARTRGAGLGLPRLVPASAPPLMSDDLLLFGLEASRGFAADVARALGTPLAVHEERGFEDGEHKTRPLESVRGRDVYVVQSLYGDAAQTVNDKLVRLLFFVGALRDASAARVTAVVPYLAYARKDRKSKSRDPVTTRYVAQLFEAVGADRIVTLDVHNLAAYQNAFRCRTEHLERMLVRQPHFAGRLADAAGRACLAGCGRHQARGGVSPAALRGAPSAAGRGLRGEVSQRRRGERRHARRRRWRAASRS